MWDNLKASIASVVRTNNNQEITGANLQSVLNTIVNTVGANATFAGIAVPSTNPGTPDGPIFYIACEPGVYSNFNLTLVDGLYILENKTGSWVGTQINTGAAFEALIGYYNAVLNGASITVPEATTYRLTKGGVIRLKMLAPGTTATTLTIGNATNIPIWYNGAAVSEQNTWEANEIISVFYDGTRFMASNSQGGGGKAEKISYNSQSGLNAENVQEALDDIGNTIVSKEEIAVSSYTPRDYVIKKTDGNWSASSSRQRYRHIRIPVTEGETFILTASPLQLCDYGWLYDNAAPSAGDPAHLVSGTSVQMIPAGETASITAPPTAQYLYIRTNVDSTTPIYPTYLARTSGIDEKVNELNQDINSIKGSDFYEIPLNQLALYKGALGASSYTFNDWGSHYVIPTNGATRMKITPKQNGNAYVYFLKTYTAPSADGYVPDFCTGFASRQAYSTEQIVSIPSDCNYIVVYAWYSNTTDNSPSNISLGSFNTQIYRQANNVEEKVDGDAYGITFAQGSYGTTGKPNYNVGYVHSNLVQGERTIQVEEGYLIHYLFKWNSVNSIVSYTVEDVSIINIPDDGYYYNIVVKKSDGSNISPDDDILKIGSSDTVFDATIGENLARLRGAVINVIGDSISNPARTEYANSKIWWRVAADALGMTVGTYSTISGTPVAGSASDSFHKRVKNLTLDGTVTIIAGGMNDLGTDNSPLGTFDYSSSLDSQIAADSTLTNKFIPAYRETIEWILSHNKNTRLYLCTITPRAVKKSGMSGAQYFFPWTNTTTGNNWAEFNEAIRKLAHDYGLGLIDWRNIGMYQQNGFRDESGTLPADNIWTSDGVHPNVTYQKKMGDFATHVLMETMF